MKTPESQSQIADVSALVGRSFVATSDNVARISLIGPGGLEVLWKRKPSEADVTEFSRFADGIVGATEQQLYFDRRTQRRAYDEWRRKIEGGTDNRRNLPTAEDRSNG